MIFLVDMDGVLADFETAFFEAVKTVPELNGVVTRESRKSFDFEKDYPEELTPSIKSVYHKKGFYLNLPEIPGAIAGVRKLKSLGHTVIICTAPLTLYRHCVLEKYRWIDVHLGMEFVKSMIVTKDKTLVVGNYLIDDKPTVIGKMVRPHWEHILYDAPYNRDIKGKRRFTWSDENIEKLLL